MSTGNAIPLQHPSAARDSLARRATTLAGQLLFAAALIVGGTIAIALFLTFVFVAAPIVAAIVLWVIARSGDGAARRARRMRVSIRRRARALGLTVVA